MIHQKENTTGKKIVTQVLERKFSRKFHLDENLPWFLGNNLYVVEKTGMRIDLMTIDGAHQRVLIMDNLAAPSDVALDPVNG